ncbi:MAG: tRNA1(Val) A37 N6-methylase TrmN6 [Bacteriovoracaceae bacterium]
MKNISDYSQPDFYHFSEDSLELVQFASEVLASRNDLTSAVDLGAGCGVIGIEALLKNPNISKMTFLEVQKEFIPFIIENLQLAEINDAKILNIPLSQFEAKVDIIFSNPPYFKPGSGRVSENRNRQVCRTFEIDGMDIFFKKLKEALTKNGLIFFCIKDEEEVAFFLNSFKLVKKRKTESATLICLAGLDID